MDESHKRELARHRKRKYRAIKKDINKDYKEITMLLQTANENKTREDLPNEENQIFIKEMKNNDHELCSDIQEFEKQATNFKEAVLQADLDNKLEENIVMPDDENNENIVSDNNEIEALKLWAIEENITFSALDKLLGILRKRLIPELPKSYKTFLDTELTDYQIIEMKDYSTDVSGEFVYMGISAGLEFCITNFHKGTIELIINIDGLPLTRSAGKCFWPILCKVHYIPDIYKPFIVGIYCGNSKPKDLFEYLKKFIEEINYLQEYGINLFQKTFIVKLKCFAADTPARSYLKCTKGHGGYSACERCTIYGVRHLVRKISKVIYPGINHKARTNKSFRKKNDPEHHMGKSPLEDIKPPIDMTTCFLLDYMHLACVGVMKKLLEMLMYGSLKIRLSPIQKMKISKRLLSLRSQLPSEFQRKTRSIFCVRQWKATEFRFFLLYCGPIVLRGIICKNLYRHFLLLHFAMRILCSDRLAIEFNAKAKKYLQKFVLLVPELYGKEALVINIHNLVHIADDVLNMGCSLSRINCFPFENTLGRIKRTLRTAVKPLSQICRREHERKMQLKKQVSLPNDFKIHKFKIINNTLHITKLTINFSILITTKSPDNIVLLENGHIMEIETMYGSETVPSAISISGKVWMSKKKIYSFPEKSTFVETWEINSKSSDNFVFPLTFVQQKLIMMKLKMIPQIRGSRIFVMSLLHV